MANAEGSSAAEAHALRSELASVLRAMAGSGDGTGVEALIASFVDRASRLQRSFAVAALRDAAETDEEDVEAVRAEVKALREELSAKEALLSAHRANVQRWHAECASVSREMVELPGANPRLPSGSGHS